MSLTNGIGEDSSSAYRPVENCSSDGDAPVDKNEGRGCKRSKPTYALHNRQRKKSMSESNVDCKEETSHRSNRTTEDTSSCITEEENCQKSDQENSNPISTTCWRARCGRKRKYFGQNSVRQGATKRERNRFNIIQEAFEELRKVIPKEQHPKDGRLSKFATLKLAIGYITLLGNALEAVEKMDQTKHISAFMVPDFKHRSQNEASLNVKSGLDDDELYTGDFTDMLRAAEENEGLDFYDEVMKYDAMEFYTSANAILIR